MAATSSVEVVNIALSYLGQKSLASLDDGTKSASLASALYDTERDAALRAHPWNFAVKREKLAKDSAAPAFEFSASFQLPSDCLRILETEPPKLRFKREGRKILCNSDTLSIKYIARITSPSEWDQQFTIVFAHRLAWKMAYTLTEQVGVVDRLAKAYEVLLSEARSVDSQEDSPEDIVYDVLGEARRSGLNNTDWWKRVPGE